MEVIDLLSSDIEPPSPSRTPWSTRDEPAQIYHLTSTSPLPQHPTPDRTGARQAKHNRPIIDGQDLEWDNSERSRPDQSVVARDVAVRYEDTAFLLSDSEDGRAVNTHDKSTVSRKSQAEYGWDAKASSTQPGRGSQVVPVDEDEEFLALLDDLDKIRERGSVSTGGPVVEAKTPVGMSDAESLLDDIFEAAARLPVHKSTGRPSGHKLAMMQSSSQPEVVHRGVTCTSDVNRVSAPLRRAETFTYGTTHESSDEIDDDEPRRKKRVRPRPKPRPRSKMTEDEKETRRFEREQAREERERIREDEKDRKQYQKELAASEKREMAELAEVNRARLDKKETTKEMIVDLPASMVGSTVMNQTQEFMKNLEAETTVRPSDVDNVIRWRRKSKAKWNKVDKRWEPLQESRVYFERQVLCWMSAVEFAELAASCADGTVATGAKPSPPVNKLETHVALMRSKYGADSQIIYLIENRAALVRKHELREKRVFDECMNREMADGNAMGAAMPAATAKKRKATCDKTIDVASMKAALLSLQVVHGCLVHECERSFESAEWIACFTQHISLIPYREREREVMANFCMEKNQVRSGENPADCYFRMLQEVVRVTPAIAKGIIKAYPDVTCLMNAFVAEGSLMLQDVLKAPVIRTGQTKTGTRTDRIGPSISQRLHGVFTTRDPQSMRV